MMKTKIVTIALAMIIALGAIASVVYAQQKSIEKPAATSESNTDCPMMKTDAAHSERPPLMRKNKTPANAKTDDHSKHADHLAAVNERGEKEMGFSQTKTRHHFLLRKDGGAIQVEVNDPQDLAARAQIRSHLTEIAKAFTAHDFETPLAVHGQIPPGVPQMKTLSKSIKYEYQELPNGGRVRISTDNAEALTAIHEFLRFQITDHQTKDSLEVGEQ